MWHYTFALKNIFGISTNFIWATFHFFSLSLLARSFFAPWERLNEAYRKGMGIGDFFGTLFINLLMRLIGAFLRGLVIFGGMILAFLLILSSVMIYILWLALPLLVVYFLITGIALIVS